jgi:hypothetical protein
MVIFKSLIGILYIFSEKICNIHIGVYKFTDPRDPVDPVF